MPKDAGWLLPGLEVKRWFALLIVGAVLAIVPVNFLNGYLVKMHNFFMIPISIYSQFVTILAVLLLGVCFAAGGSLMSIKKHLEV